MFFNLFLVLIGLGASIHLMCTAAYMSPKAPISLILEVVSGFGAAVGATIASIHDDQQRALMFFGVLTLCLVLFSLEKGARGQSYVIKIAQKMNRRKTDRLGPSH